jgi:hypothetical protein
MPSKLEAVQASYRRPERQGCSGQRCQSPTVLALRYPPRMKIAESEEAPTFSAFPSLKDDHEYQLFMEVDCTHYWHYQSAQLTEVNG